MKNNLIHLWINDKAKNLHRRAGEERAEYYKISFEYLYFRLTGRCAWNSWGRFLSQVFNKK